MPKKAYVGVVTDVPIYEESTGTVNLTADNIANYFSVSNGQYYFEWNGAGWVSNNGGIASSSATTVLTALQDISNLSFGYYYSSEASYDKFTLKVGGTTVENEASGTKTNKTWTGSLAKGKTIELTYAKDGSQDKNDDKCGLYSVTFTGKVLTQVGSERKSVAREVKSIYVGVNGPVPVYTTDAKVAINGGNLTNYFTKERESRSDLYASASSTYFYGASSISMTLYARYDMDVSFTAGYDCGDYNDMSMEVYAKGETVLDYSGRNRISKTWTGHLKAGQAIKIYFDNGSPPDEEDNSDPDRPTVFIQDIVLTNVTRQTGTATKEAARAVKKAYIGVNGVARPFFERSADTVDIVYTGGYTDRVVTMDDKQYRLLTLISSGKLVLAEDVTADIWMCGGGTSGVAGNGTGFGTGSGSSSGAGTGGGGGAGAYFATFLNRKLKAGNHAAVVGAGGSSTPRVSSSTVNGKADYNGGGVSSLDDLTHTALNGGTVATRRTGVSGASGGGGGYRYVYSSSGETGPGGSGGGVSTIPFGSSYFEPHCSGGSGGSKGEEDSSDDTTSWTYGAAGGVNGADGATSPSSQDPTTASIYGSGGRGGHVIFPDSKYESVMGGAGSSGIQGVIYIRIPL